MTKWKDEKAGYADPSIIGSNIKLGKFKLSVHRHINYEPDAWFASCYGIFDMIALKSKKLSEAKCQAKAKVQVVLEDALKDICDA